MTALTRLKAVCVAAVLTVMCGAPRDASAQATCTFTNGSPCTLSPFNVSLSPTDVLRLKLGSTTTNLGSPVKADYTTGYIASGGPTLIRATRVSG